MSTLPPDPDGQNDDRARWATHALLAFRSITGTDGTDALADLLCDLMHWADRNGQNFVAELNRARDNYADETLAPLLPPPKALVPAPTRPVVTLDYDQFRAAYTQARTEGGDSATEQEITASWYAYQRDPAGHFISREGGS